MSGFPSGHCVCQIVSVFPSTAFAALPFSPDSSLSAFITFSVSLVAATAGASRSPAKSSPQMARGVRCAAWRATRGRQRGCACSWPWVNPPSSAMPCGVSHTRAHLAAAIRDQPADRGAQRVATWRMGRRRAEARVRLLPSAPECVGHSRTRFMRAEGPGRARRGRVRHAHDSRWSIVYAPGDVFLTCSERMALLPVVPSISGCAVFQPIWAQDVADDGGARPPRLCYELSGPRHDRRPRVARGRGRPRRLVHVPAGRGERRCARSRCSRATNAFATWDEAELMESQHDGPPWTATLRRSA